ncbi:tyrosine-protein kinase-like otk, partial [Teleopsis dalmanni]|uniref:tyrosine-protein kinase-like otk n=1 Tax=Teleopsis dalmanni TaxID=139649 RepID=UPI0018CF81CE
MYSKSKIIFAISVLHFCAIQFVKAEYSEFVTLPQSQTVVEGDSVIFTCRASPENDLKYSWTFNGLLLHNSTKIKQINSNLIIERVNKSNDEGDYVCIATNTGSGARQASPPARLKINVREIAFVHLVYSKIDEIVLECRVDCSHDNSNLKIEWFHNNDKLSYSKNIELIKNRLYLRNISIKDNGSYRCTANNQLCHINSKNGYKLNLADLKPMAGHIGSNCIPRIKKTKGFSNSYNHTFLCRGKRGGASSNTPILREMNQIIEQPQEKFVIKENDQAELHCSYKANDNYLKADKFIQLRWRKDGKIIRQIDLIQNLIATVEPNKDLMLREDVRIMFHRENGSLTFNGVIASDAGLYSCEMYIEGEDAALLNTAELQIIEQLKFMPQPTTSKNLELGLVGKVHCKAQGTPPPRIRWLKDVNETLSSDTIEDINGTLIFKNVTAMHKGNYTCIASNSQGQINATVSVNVVVAPKFLVAPEGPIETEEKGIVVFHCQAIGDPKPTIQWDKDLQYLSENNTDINRFYFLENGTLEIRDVQPDDEGNYGCTIGNSAGLKREEVKFVVKSVDNYLVDGESNEGFLITRAVMITMTVALAYIVLVVGLMIWCRYRRQARKARLEEANKENSETGEHSKMAENEPCLTESNSMKNQTPLKTKKVNGNKHPRNSGNDPQKSDDTACSNHSKGSKFSHAFDQLTLPRTDITELIQIGRGEFGDIFVGKIKESIIKERDDFESDSKKKNGYENINQITSGNTSTNLNFADERRSKTSMDNIEEIKEEQESGNGDTKAANDNHRLILVKALNKVKDEYACQEFKRQIEMFRAISHKGVVRLYGVCREKDPHYIVLE